MIFDENIQSMISPFLEGFFLQASLILALGAQNLFVLDSGLRRQRPFFVALVCSICDLLLIFAGVLGVATLFIQVPLLKILFGVLGVGFLVYYGLLKLKEAYRPSVETNAAVSKKSLTLKQTFLATLGFSLLNPHVYLDTVVLIGGYSAKFSSLVERFFFGVGASVFSGIWFFGLVILATLFRRLVHSEKAMRMISLVSGLILLGLCVRLGGDVAGWIRDWSNG
jgi:L-lysine exporter family protein LysE/ArgO